MTEAFPVVMADDGGVPPPSNELLLTWRMDPDESLSDWSIDIVFDQTDDFGAVTSKTDTYHVHKCHLAGGTRKSGYFVKLFSDGGRFAETRDGTSRIVLKELAARAFPDMLDYLYSVSASPKINTMNAGALSYLAKYFDLPYLRWLVKKFWEHDIQQAPACGTYFEHAYILHEETILREARKVCKNRIHYITADSRLVRVADERFWIELVSEQPHMSRHISTLLAAYCRHNPVKKQTFAKLTDTQSLREISADAALWLMDVERELVGPSDAQLTSLQERCIDAYAREWTRVDNSKKKDLVDLLRKQNSLVLAELLVRTMSSGGYRY